MWLTVESVQWDTANVYSDGVSEEIIGKAIKEYKLPRHKLVILTKCNGTVGEEPGIMNVPRSELAKSKDYVNQAGSCKADLQGRYLGKPI